MASLKLIVCCVVALVVAAVVDAHPSCKKRHPRRHHKCADEWIGRFFIEIDCTIGCDMDWIDYQIDLINCKRDVGEYQAIIDLYRQLEQARGCFDTSYEGIYTDIFGRVTEYRKKYSPLSIYYTERIVSARKCARRRLIPELCKLRNLYYQIIALLDEFCGKYSIDRQPRAISLPREDNYNFDLYYPISPRSKDLSLIYQNCFKDYRFLYDLLNKLNFPDNSPLCGRRKKIYDDIINIWVDFDNFRRGLDIKYYPRFLDCFDNEGQIDLIYIELINQLRPYQIKFGNCWFDIYVQIQDLCNEGNVPFIDYVDWDNWTPQVNCRGSYLPSPLLSNYFNNILVTCGMDYYTARRLWNELDCKPDSDMWRRRKQCLDDLRRKLCELERAINRLIRDIIRRINNDYINCLDNFDTAQRAYIDEVINNCNNDLWPLIIDFRNQYYVNDDSLLPIFQERGITDVTRNIIPSQTFGYDISLYCFDQELRDLIRWFENCLRDNYYVPVSDLIQIRFDEGCEEYKLRSKCLKDLECIWLDYRKLQHELFRKLIDLICNRKCKIGCDDYRREIKCIIDWLRPRLIDLINRFKSICCDINGILDNLYSRNNNKSCRRRYKYIEASFQIQISGSVKVC